MNGIQNGSIKFSSLQSYVTFNENSTIFESTTINYVEINRQNGIIITINKNIIISSGYVKFIFNSGNMNVAKNVNIMTYGSNGNIIFETNNTMNNNIIINSLPVTISANHTTSNITIDIAITLNRSMQ